MTFQSNSRKCFYFTFIVIFFSRLSLDVAIKLNSFAIIYVCVSRRMKLKLNSYQVFIISVEKELNIGIKSTVKWNWVNAIFIEGIVRRWNSRIVWRYRRFKELDPVRWSKRKRTKSAPRTLTFIGQGTGTGFSSLIKISSRHGEVCSVSIQKYLELQWQMLWIRDSHSQWNAT